MAAVIRMLIDIEYSEPILSDHGRRIWNENVPLTGYGLWQGIEEARKMHVKR